MTTASRWLSAAAAEPRTALALWKNGRTAPLTVGARWDLLAVDFKLATAAVTHFRDHGYRLGPYLMSGVERTVWWCVPIGAGRRFTAQAGVASRPKGSEIFVPPPGAYAGDRVWVSPRDGRWSELTDPGELHEALGVAARRLAQRTVGPRA
ncbi:hypothetical protein [Streptomyces huiliensis]|uniref:hypothetical protein n=1 Tax=Streptomyces huiliensis TaxID=2876027 RepID=UPI001CBC1DF4|nr:hypothetical protein [Streptomyces huiliensis]MBZ4320225.1 hypothetical protein [Streptomyces huiliensis]